MKLHITSKFKGHKMLSIGTKILRQKTLLFLLTALAIQNSAASTPFDSLKVITQSQDFAEIAESANLKIDLRYASENNFMGLNLYKEFNRAFLHKDAAAKLLVAENKLAQEKPNYKLIVFDALRPRSVQELLWNKVKGTKMQPYVANPKTGSIHNYGFAVDISIVDEKGKELDMGTPFDDFSSLAQPKLEGEFLKSERLNTKQIANRLLLRKVMTEAGFTQLPIEWWHFDALDKKTIREKYKIIE